MLVKFSDNYFKQIFGIFYWNRGRITAFAVIATIAVLQYKFNKEYLYGYCIDLPVIPVSILGGALAIFLGFRNSSAYDRWWEARKIWGGIVNYSRSFGMLSMSFASTFFNQANLHEEEVKNWQKEVIHRHIAWLYLLAMHLRKNFDWKQIEKYLSEEEVAKLKQCNNKPAQLVNMQALRVKDAYERGMIEDFRHMEFTSVLKEFYNLQGKSERIKNTIFPYYYNYFTRMFLWLFIICLPFALVSEMGWSTIPMCIAISFVFSILEKSGIVTEEPFEGRAADTPILTICRGIEIDLLQMLSEENIPDPLPVRKGKFSVEYFE